MPADKEDHYLVQTHTRSIEECKKEFDKMDNHWTPPPGIAEAPAEDSMYTRYINDRRRWQSGGSFDVPPAPGAAIRAAQAAVLERQALEADLKRQADEQTRASFVKLREALLLVTGEVDLWGKDMVLVAAGMIREHCAPRETKNLHRDFLHDLKFQTDNCDALDWKELRDVQQKVCALNDKITREVERRLPAQLEKQRIDHKNQMSARSDKHMRDVREELARRAKNKQVPFGHEGDDE